MLRMINLLKVNMKLFFKHKILTIFAIIFPLVFYVFFSLIFTNYDSFNNIPVGLIDQDQSVLSTSVVESLKLSGAIDIRTEDLKSSEKYLKSNKIEAYFIIRSGFEEAIQQSEYDNIIEIHYLDKSTIGPALGDIIASEIMMPLSIYKAANTSITYSNRYDLKNVYDETISLGYQFLKENTFEMKIDSEVITPKALLKESLNIEKILKINTTFGLSLLVYSFVVLFSNSFFIDTSYRKTLERQIIAGYTKIELYLSQLFSIFLTGLFVLVSEFIVILFVIDIHSSMQAITIFIALLLHLLMLSSIIVVLTNVIHKRTTYQSIIAPSLFILGLLGGAFWSLELLAESIKKISYISPFYWSLKIINESILNIYQNTFNPLILWYLSFTVILLSISYMIFSNYIRSIKN